MDAKISGPDPLVSCIMPTYGRPDYVNEAVAMFLAQDYGNKELIVLNDCCGQQFEFDHPNVRVENRSERYVTLGEKRNACIDMAQGDLIAIWDDDDIYLPWRISFTVSEMEHNNLSFYRPQEFWAYWGEEKLHKNETVRGWVNHAFVVFTKQLWRDIGGYRPMNVGEDATFFDCVHQHLKEEWIVQPIRPEDRFFILRGKSRYKHMSIGGGQEPLDTKPGRHVISPCSIADPVLRSVFEELILQRASVAPDGLSSAKMLVNSRYSGLSAPIELSVCISLKNRSRIMHDDQSLEIFPNFVRSLVDAADQLGMKSGIELIIADYGSDDWPLVDWLDDATDGLPFRIVNVEGDFSRGGGLNLAANEARSDRLFLCDADMLINESLLRRGIEAVERGNAFFPVFRYLDIDGNPKGLETFSYGNAFLASGIFQRAGGVPEFKSWGGEDDIFFARVRRMVKVEREHVQGFDHQWHPDRCRHEHYVHERKSDFLAFRARPSTVDEQPIEIYDGQHPHWSGQVHLFANGRMCRPGMDSGSYILEEGKRLVLQWDRWPAEELLWDKQAGVFKSQETPFRLSLRLDIKDSKVTRVVANPQSLCGSGIIFCRSPDFAYVPIPKAGCTSIKRSIAMAFDLPCANLPHDDFHWAMPSNRVIKIIAGEKLAQHHNGQAPWTSTFLFSIVRDPYKRIVSAYISKVVQKQHGLEQNPHLRCARSFSEFVARLTDIPPTELDEHLRPQSLLLKGHRVNYLGLLDNLKQHLEYIGERIGRKISNRWDNPSSSPSIEEELSDDAIRRKIEAYYSDDQALIEHLKSQPKSRIIVADAVELAKIKA